ncbi:MAG: hydantoinase B/oxoprolinase family protein, partial [Dehalococcoidia bacterium]|nr:hydantoinase B/oxoprolinase family protein [Dehalococcoidia bacterium]
RAQLVANNLMRIRLVELIETQGIADFGELSETILSRSEAAMRKAIGQIPDGDYEHEICIDGFECPLTFKVKISIRGTEIAVDYAGTSEQSEYAINSPRLTTPMATPSMLSRARWVRIYPIIVDRCGR